MTTLSRSRLRWLVVVTGMLLLAGVRLAPSLPLSLVTPVSLLWLLLAAFLLYAGYTVLGAWIGPRAAAVVVVVAVVLPVAGTLLPAPVDLGARLQWGTWRHRAGGLPRRQDGRTVGRSVVAGRQDGRTAGAYPCVQKLFDSP